MNINKSEICAIIVTYNSSIESINNIFLYLKEESIFFIVSDNSDNQDMPLKIQELTENYGGYYLCMNDNIGIASAQNYGVNEAFNRDYKAVLLLDDDSLPMPSMVDLMLCYFNKVKEKNIILCARTINRAGVDVSNAPPSDSEVSLCRELMSSGALITKDVFSRVGPFNDSLFIDCVDFEWGWRAQKMGISINICNKALLKHELGHGQLFGAGLPSPVRHYYQYRNILNLIFSPHPPLQWKFLQFFKLIIKLFYILLVFPEKKTRLYYAVNGISDAFFKNNGKLSKTR